MSAPPERRERPPAPGEPEVLLDVELDGGRLWIVLANPSDRTAFDVGVKFGGSLMGAGGRRDITEQRIFSGLPMLRPRSRIRIFVDTARALFARDEPRQVTGRVRWRSREGQAFAEPFRHDIGIWEDFGEI